MNCDTVQIIQQQNRVSIECNAIRVISIGVQGPPGPGVPLGGTTGQYLIKRSNADFDTEWITGGGGSGAMWGQITGTLSNQTDLQAALNSLVPYTGATTNVDIGTNSLSSQQYIVATSTSASNGNIVGANVLAAFPDDARPIIHLMTNDDGSSGPVNSITLTNSSSINKFAEWAGNTTQGAPSGENRDTWAIQVDYARNNTEDFSIRHAGQMITNYDAANTKVKNFVNMVIDSAFAYKVTNAAGTTELNALRMAGGDYIQFGQASASIAGMQFYVGSAGLGLQIMGSTGAISAPSLAGTGTRMVVADASGNISTQVIGGGGTVTSVSGVNANGFTVGAGGNPTITPAITVGTPITGIIKGNGTAILAATAGVDYLTPSGASSLYVPYTGATGSVALGPNGLTASSLTAQPSSGASLIRVVKNLAADLGRIEFNTLTTKQFNIGSGINTLDDSNLDIGTDSAPIMRLVHAGRVLIGTTTDDGTTRLQINGAIVASGTMSASNFTGSSSGTNTGDQTTITGNAGTATKWQTARLLAGNSVDGGANVAFANKFIVQGTADSGLSGAQFLGSLGTGIVKNTATTGVLSIAVAADFPTLNQNTTGSAATLTTPRAINGVNFDGSAAITVAADAGTLTGATLAAGVTSSSLTGVGVINSGTWNGTSIAVAHGGTGAATGPVALANLGVKCGVTLVASGAGVALTAGTIQGTTVARAFTITNWAIEADLTGAVTLDILRNGVSIIGAGTKPALASAQSATGTPTGWTSVAIAAGDIITGVISSPSTITYVNLVVYGTPA